MNTDQSQPPALAVWLLRRLGPKRNREVITGDLLERFHEGRSGRWFWRQVLVAILAGTLQRRLWKEVYLATAGTALIWCFPWSIFPIESIASMNWGARAQWLIVIEITTALLVLPLFAIIFRLRGTLGWGNLLRVFSVCAMLCAAGDVTITWWTANHLVPSPTHAAWAVLIQLGWIFVTLLISARVSRGLHSSSRTNPA